MDKPTKRPKKAPKKKQSVVQKSNQNVTINLTKRASNPRPKSAMSPPISNPNPLLPTHSSSGSFFYSDDQILLPSRSIPQFNDRANQPSSLGGSRAVKVQSFQYPYAVATPIQEPFDLYVPPSETPPMLPVIALDPVNIRQNTGSYQPRSLSIGASSNTIGRAYDEDIMNFEQNQSRNELLKKDREDEQFGMDTQESIRNSYNLSLNTEAGENDPSFVSEIAYPQTHGSGGRESLIGRDLRSLNPGRPTKGFTEDEQNLLRRYVATRLIPARDRSLEQRSIMQLGKALIDNRRNNPLLDTILNSYVEDYLNSGKKV